jgi:hypothetical protein
MRLILAALGGALAGFALVFLGEAGFLLGLVAAAALVLIAVVRRDGRVPGVAIAAGGLVVTVLTGRVVLTSFGDPSVTFEIQTAAFLVLGAIAVGVGAVAATVAWSPRSGSSNDGTAGGT